MQVISQLNAEGGPIHPMFRVQPGCLRTSGGSPSTQRHQRRRAQRAQRAQGDAGSARAGTAATSSRLQLQAVEYIYIYMVSRFWWLNPMFWWLNPMF